MMQRRPPRRRTGVKRNTWVLLLIVVLVGVAIWVLTPISSVRFGRKGMRLGLDLKGGTQLVYQADLSGQEDPSAAMDEVVRKIRERIDRYGVTEPVIRQQGTDRILVQLPGITNIEDAKAIMEKTAYLEFREVELNGTTPVTLGDYLNGNRTTFFENNIPGSRVFAAVATTGTVEPVVLLVMKDGVLSYVDVDGNPVDTSTLGTDAKSAYSWMLATGTITTDSASTQKALTGADLTKSVPQIDSQGNISVGIALDGDGQTIFNQIAPPLYNQTSSPLNLLGIFLDNELISNPRMQVSSYSSGLQITGNFTWDEARILAAQLSSGALPVPLKSLYEEQISATLGTNFLHRAILAGGIGLALVILFMVLYYGPLGAVAAVALLIYAALVLAVFKLIPVTLTLAGIAGFVVSLGMAVDANVLIFERMKEELRGGRTPGAAIESGFNRAWSAIRDSNITTFIACGVMYWFGSRIFESPQVMGFALTLFIGVAASMFTAITVSHSLIRIFVTLPVVRGFPLLRVKQETVNKL
jgi:preprotein translocase subunit SecD